MSYNSKLETPVAWWLTFDTRESQLPNLAIKLFAIVPSQAGCERNFSTLGWMIGNRRTRLTPKRVESLAKVRAFWMSNIQKEMAYHGKDLSDDVL